MKKRDYNKDSVITRKMAWEDFRCNFTELYLAVKHRDLEEFSHTWTDFRVNAVRMVFGAYLDRDTSQDIGRIITVAELLGYGYLAIKVLT